ncbi:MAG: HAD-IC family P-type ATPase, partial [Clostridia bacterium]|nr:HAD-IC family P-type ATPase [Clostridia bacterium]
MKKTQQKAPIERVQADAERGLTAQQVRERTEKGYVNKVTDTGEKTGRQILFSNLFTFFNTILFSIALLFIVFDVILRASGRADLAGEYFGISKYVFLIPALMNVVMGTAQELKSLKVIRSLRIVTGSKNRVVRDGKLATVDSEEIVVDDVLSLSAGDQATADVTVISGSVSVDESMLTGESDYIKKESGDTILSGSSVIVGNACCRVTEVGDDTYAAKLSKKVKSGARHKSELMDTIEKIMRVLAISLTAVIATVIVTLVIKFSLNGEALDLPHWAQIALTGGSFGIGIIPSGLVLTTSVALMVSIAQLSKKKTLIQELYSLENLSRVDVICLDKTGTLTDGTMNVVDVKAFTDEETVTRFARDLIAAAGERNATMEAVYQRFGLNEKPDYKEVIPFSSATKYSGVVYQDGKKLLMGAPEYLLDKGDENLAFSSEAAARGQRVLAMVLDGALQAFILIEDHIRDTAPDTLKFFQENGVTVKVISGDNPLTVSKIAQMCGIHNAEKHVSLAGVPLEDIPAMAEEYTVFARVSPEQKEALVTALQARGHKVAMTGDGVNDILALRKSDSSITFAKATEAAKSCSDVVLLDNDFSHLKEVVGEGRRVIGNIQKTTVLYLMKSIAVILLGFALIPFSKGQLLFNIESVYMLEAAVIGTGGFLLSLEPRRTPIRGSFIKNITGRSLAAGILAASSILMPVLLNVLPKAAGAAPYVADANLQCMMTVLMTIAGLVVVFSMCIPFNKYRTLALIAVTAVAGILGMMLPTSFIGGQTMSPEMFAGESIFQSPFMHEFLQPWNSPAVQGLLNDVNNYIVLRTFLYVAIPVFILVMFAAENHAR